MSGAMAPTLDGAIGKSPSLEPTVSMAVEHVQPSAVMSPATSVQTLLAQLVHEAGAPAAEVLEGDEVLDGAEFGVQVDLQAEDPTAGALLMPAMQAWMPQQGLGVGMQRALPVGVAQPFDVQRQHTDRAESIPMLGGANTSAARSDMVRPMALTPLATEVVDAVVQPGQGLAATWLQQGTPARTQGMLGSVAGTSPEGAVPVHQGAQALVQSLAQRLQVQQIQGQQVAVVRLDPPQMGTIELRISHDAAGVQVHMQASNSEVGRQLTTLVDPLRQELLARSADAQITVASSRSAGAGGQSEARQQAPVWEEEPEIGQALQSTERALHA